MMTEYELAQLARKTLDAQQQYFKSRSKDDLIASKELERKLRKEANEILAGF